MPDINVILATDCGSTTTKAILIEKINGQYRLTARGEAPTTVEAPAEDVTRGVINSIAEIEDITGKTFIKNDKLIVPREDNKGADIYVSTSSAGGGLQMMVAGVVKQMSAESAERAALGAGAIVMDVLATNDKRRLFQRIERIRNLRPDMILISGGTDGGTVRHVVSQAEVIAAADPKPRFGIGYELPVIFAGNIKARDAVKETLSEKTALQIVDNLRPTLENENLKPARDAIHDIFLEHVMQHAPGYKKLMKWTSAPIMPTPGAVGDIMQLIAKRENIQVVGTDIGGATTDDFSVFRVDKDNPESPFVFNRTVSANLGMSYSISNVVSEAGIPNIMRWVSFDVDERILRNSIRNKMIRPTTIPQGLNGLIIEQAICREALRLAFIQHKQMAVGLRGVQKQSSIGDAFSQKSSDETLVDMIGLDLIVGSGGVLSHAPRRNQSALMMIDGFAPEGITNLAVDSIFMMPHLGVLAQINENAAIEVFEKDCLIYLGAVIAPVGVAPYGKPCMTVEIHGKGKWDLKVGEMKLIPATHDEEFEVTIIPNKKFDIGAGRGKTIERKVKGGIVGIILDARCRPIMLPEDHNERISALQSWNKELNIYPEI
ncbi:glutamate mutase L [bacterium]|nr:glutamate mutase L [bacterium]